MRQKHTTWHYSYNFENHNNQWQRQIDEKNINAGIMNCFIMLL